MSTTVDSDFWPQRGSASTIAPYLDPSVRAYLRPGQSAPGGGPPFELPEGGIRSLAERAVALADEEDPHERATRHLDSEGIARAVLNSGVAAGLSGLANGELAVQMARAINDWLSAEWLETDERYRGSITISARNAKLAAGEIRRLGSDPRFVQILMAYPPDLLGDQTLYPIHEAAEECGLPINLQAGGSHSGINKGVVPVGYPTSPLEDQLGRTIAAQPHLVSMIVRGVFDRFPGLRVVLSGFGMAWLPGLLWRMDLEARAGRLDNPVELSRLPSEYVRERVRFTTQPLEIPSDPDALVALLGTVGGGDLLMYGSGHPQWHDTAGVEALRSALPDAWTEGVFATNARHLYRL